MIENIQQILLQRGYPETAAMDVAKKLVTIDSSLKPSLNTWLENGETPNVEANGFTTDGLMSERKGMTYPAALLTIDWLIREPERAAKTIKRGVR